MNRQDPTPGVIPAARVLLVEPDIDRARVVRAAVAPHDVTLCGSGGSALSLLERIPFDVLVAELQLPDMHARELLERVRATDPVLARNALLIAERRLSIPDEEFLDERGTPVVFLPLRPERVREEVRALAARAMLAVFALAGSV